MRAIGNKIIIEIDKDPKQTKAGLLLPSDVTKGYKVGKVIEVGPGEKDIPMSVSKGDTIYVPSHSGTIIIVDEKEYTVVSQLDVLAIV
jgi:chaperonin GroES